jgi:hypothetical protein
MLEAQAPQLGAGEKLPQLFGRVVDRVRGNRRAVLMAMPASPRNQLDHVVVGDLGEQLVLAEELNQERQPMLGTVRSGVILPDLLPVALGHVVEAQRCLGRRQLRDQHPRLLTLGRLYFFGFTPRRAFRAAMKPMTSDLEVEMPVRRAAVPVFVDGHGTSFRV